MTAGDLDQEMNMLKTSVEISSARWLLARTGRWRNHYLPRRLAIHSSSPQAPSLLPTPESVRFRALSLPYCPYDEASSTLSATGGGVLLESKKCTANVREAAYGGCYRWELLALNIDHRHGIDSGDGC